MVGMPYLLSHLYKLSAIEATEVLSVVNISKLVANNASIADCCIYIGVRVPEYPHIDTAISNEVAQLRSEGTIK